MRRLTCLLALTMGLFGSSAFGQEGSDTWGQGGGDLESGAGGSGPEYFAEVERFGPGRAGVGSSDRPCTFERYDYHAYQLFWRSFPIFPGPTDPLILEGDEGADSFYERDWIVVMCRDDTGTVIFIDGFQLGEPPDPGPLQEHARRSLRIPLPEARFNPEPPAPQVVGLQTWLWVDVASVTTRTATACIPDTAPFYACATVTAGFVDTLWSMGVGTPELACDGPGRPYDQSQSYADQADLDHCAHVYLRADPGGSTYDVVATTIWGLTWTCAYDAGLDGGLDTSCGGGDLGLVGRSGPPVPLEVLDLQARAQ